MGLAILFLILYLIFPSGIFMLLRYVKDYLKSYFFGRKKSSTAVVQNVKEGLNQKVKKRIKFTMADPRKNPIPFKKVFIAIYLLGLSVSILGGFLGSWSLLLVAIMISYISFIFSIITSNKIVSEREQVMKRMLELKGSKMRFVNREKGSVPSPATEFKVLEWGDDLVSPVKMHLYMPTDFDILQVDSFLESFNLIFGSNGQWIADDTDETYGGFDFNAGVAAIKVTPPLPQMANWHERYLNKKEVHWSFFPLALGAENGVPVYNEELEVTEHVLGFAVNGGQEKLSKKNGVVLGKEVTSSPQILIAGGTGGGKSINSSTPIIRIKNDQEC